MISLFVRIAGTVALAIIAALVLIQILFGADQEKTALDAFGGHAKLVADAIAATPPAERKERAHQLAKSGGYPVRLEPSHGDRVVHVDRRGVRLYVVAPVRGARGQVAIGPVPGGAALELSKIVATALLVSLAVAALAIWPIFKRIRSIETLAQRMSSGDFRARIRRQDGDFFDRVGASLNALADRIGQLLSDERDLLRTVAHEVRAPIARMRFRVDKIHRRADEKGQRDSLGLINDLAQVDNLFEELLTYVAFDEFDQNGPKLTTTDIPVRETVERVLAEVTDTNEEVEVSVQGSGQCTVEANLKLFERAVTNLLLNALAYGGGKIHVEMREKDGHCIVDVQDAGPGIPELDRPEVIKPFVRMNDKKKRGTGLGLAIVSRIMRLHTGRLYILDAPTGGASIQLVWKTRLPTPRKTREDRGLSYGHV